MGWLVITLVAIGFSNFGFAAGAAWCAVFAAKEDAAEHPDAWLDRL